MLILAILLVGLITGWLANLILGGRARPADWGELLIAGFGVELRASGVTGSVVGAVIVLVVWRFFKKRRATR